MLRRACCCGNGSVAASAGLEWVEGAARAVRLTLARGQRQRCFFVELFVEQSSVQHGRSGLLAFGVDPCPAGLVVWTCSDYGGGPGRPIESRLCRDGCVADGCVALGWRQPVPMHGRECAGGAAARARSDATPRSESSMHVNTCCVQGMLMAVTEALSQADRRLFCVTISLALQSQSHAADVHEGRANEDAHA